MSNTVRVVIELPQDQYDLIRKSDKNSVADAVSKECVMYAIRQGKLLPNSYGRCIDADQILKKSYIDGDGDGCVSVEDIIHAHTILKATPDRYYGTRNRTR